MPSVWRRTVHLVTAKPSVPYWTTIAIEAIVMIVTAVSARISSPYNRPAVVEVVTAVVIVDREEPSVSTPNDRTKEIVGGRQ